MATMLNLGCGTKTSPYVVNIDWSPYQRLHQNIVGRRAIDPDDPELLADMIQAAVNEALRFATADGVKMSRLIPGDLGGLGGLLPKR